MLRRGNPYVFAALAVVLFLVSLAVDGTAATVVLVVLAVAAAAAAVLLLVRQGRDPNGPRGQH